MKFHLPDEHATQRFAARLAASSPAHGLVFLEGDLGAGKTTLVRAFLRALGYQDTVKSPTYTLVEPYQIDARRILHFDLYRLDSPEELEYLGVREDIDGAALALVEWPDRGRGWMPQEDLRIVLSTRGSGRDLELRAVSADGLGWMARMFDNQPEDMTLSV